MKQNRFPFACLVFGAIVFIWSAWQPYDRLTWWMEVAPILVALPILFATYKKFGLTPLVYGLILVHACILMVGGHYTYARVPLFDTLRDMMGTARNSYDGIGHIAQGFIPALIGRELLLRTSPLKSGKWMFTLIVLSCFGIAAAYEVIEWIVAVNTGEAADSFLGAQGDIWDSQKDMALALAGAIAGLLLLSRMHDRQLKKLKR